MGVGGQSQSFPRALILTALWGAGQASAQEPAQDQPRYQTVVTAPRPASLELDLPLSRTTISDEQMEGTTEQGAFGEALDTVPGVLVQNRENPAQGMRLDVRGFGTRAAFGVRGLQVMLDGIPLTLPDGQTSLDGFEVGDIERIEVLRGPAAVLYGNSAGGVIRVFTAEPPGRARLRLSTSSLDETEVEAQAGARLGPVAVLLSGTRRKEDGYRQHSRSRLGAFSSKCVVRAPGAFRVTALAGIMDAPLLEDPGALTHEQMRADPRQPDPDGLLYNTREAVRQTRTGLFVEGPLGRWHHVEVSGYAVWRRFAANKLQRIIELDRMVVGGSALYRWTQPLAGIRHELSLGVNLARQNDDRQNFSSAGGGVRGPLELDQNERVMNLGMTVRELLNPWPWLLLAGGLRFDRNTFEVSDRLLGNGDQSGGRSFDSLSWLGGLGVTLAPALQVFANLGTSFETPTSTELVNRPDGAAGFNPDLRPQHARSYEVGLRGRLASMLEHHLSLFRIDLRDELVRREDGTGRVFYRNAGQSHRVGAEASLGLRQERLLAMASYTYLQARFDRYESRGLDLGGHLVPGIPPHRLALLVQYERAGFRGRTDLRWIAPTFLDDANQVRSPQTLVVNSALGYGFPWGSWEMRFWVRGANLLDWKYADNLRVNGRAERFFEPAPGLAVQGTFELAGIGLQ